MKSAAAIVVDGVLRKYVGGTPIPEGVALYRALSSVFNVILLLSEPLDPGFQHFLDTEQLIAHGDVYPVYSWLGELRAADRVFQANMMRSRGYAVDLVVEPNPEIAAALIRAGFSVLHFIHAQYQRPDWRPDYRGEQRPWDDLVEEETRVAKLRAADNRMGEFTDRMLEL